MAAAVMRISGTVARRHSSFIQQCLAFCTHDKCSEKFDTSLLDILVCPLSKEQLRYDEEMNELICDKLQVAYPIVNGIPYLIPTDGRLIKENEEVK